MRRIRSVLSAFAVAAASTACDGLLAVENPNSINGSDLDPVGDAAVFAYSAQQNLATAYANLIVYGAWFTGEALAAETFPEIHEFGRRDVSSANATLTSLWADLSVARASADRLLEYVRDSPGEESLPAARAALVAGFAYLLMAEHFCHGAVDGGSSLSPQELLELGVSRFDRVVAVAGKSQLTNAGRAEGAELAMAALVGRARARLQLGQTGLAAADAARVPWEFRLDLPYAEDHANLGRLGNRVWYYTAERATLAVAPAFRALADSRVPTAPPAPEFRPFDGITEYWTQRKYPGYSAPVRLASGVEAAYVAAEAGGAEAMRALIQSRRMASGQPAYAGPMGAPELLTEFMDQRRREFFLEGKRMGDLRRHPGSIPYLPVPGSAYHRSGYDRIGHQTCWPLPRKETGS